MLVEIKNFRTLLLVLITITLLCCKQKVPFHNVESKENSKKENNHFIVLGQGDTLQTGVPIKLKKNEFLVTADKISVTPLKKQPQVFFKDNYNKAKEPKRISLPTIKQKLNTLKVKKPKLGKDTVLVGNELKISIAKSLAAKEPFYKDNSKYDIQCMGIDQGLGSAYVNYIIEDSKENIWFAHFYNGVSKFDGKEYTEFKGESDLLANGNIWTILEDNEGNLWFSCIEEGIVKYDGKRFVQYSEDNGFLSDRVYAMTQDSHNNIWFGTVNGVVKYNNERFTYYDVDDGLSGNIVISLLEDSKGNVWMGTTTGMTVYSESKFIAYTFKEGLPPNNIISIFEDDDKNIWFGTYRGGLCKYDGNLLSVFTEKEGLINNSIKGIEQDANGNMWFGSYFGGLCKYDGKVFQHISREHGLPSDKIGVLLIDSKQNLWGATEGGGTFKFNINSFVNTSISGTMSNKISDYEKVFSIHEDAKNNLWFGTYAGELIKYDGESYSILGKEQGLDFDVIFEAMEDSHNNIWLGTIEGLIKYDGEQFMRFHRQDRLEREFKRTIDVHEDKNKNIWFIAYNSGISKFDGKKIINYTMSDRLKENRAYCIYEDKYGNLWFGTDSLGVCKYNEQSDTFTFYTKNDGLISNFVFAIYEDKSDNIWLGTDKGLSKFDGKEFINFTEKDGLIDNNIVSIISDKNDNLWVTSQKGINCIVNNNDLVSKIDSSKKVDKNAFIVNFTKNDGLKNLDFYQSTYLDQNNKLWFATSTGLITLNLNTYNFSEEAPLLRLNTVEVNEAFIDFNKLKNDNPENLTDFQLKIKKGAQENEAFKNYPEHLTLPYDLNHLNFKFSATEWSAPHAIKYSYKVDGLDDNWSIPSNENKADYRNIPPGDYTFYVKAIGKSGQWSESLQYPFTITPPWWLSTWAIGGYIILSMLLLLGSFKWYAFRMKKKQLMLERIIEERTQTITKQKVQVENQKQELLVAYSDLEQERNKMELKALLNQINPHFIFNALNSIQQFIISNNVKTSLDYFNKFGKLIRSSLEHSEMKYVSINDEIQVIQNYIDLENLRFSESVSLDFNVNDVDIYNVKIPPMFIQPIVENAIIHGLSGKAHDKRIKIDFKEQEGYMLCSIQDNGLGRKRKTSRKNKNSGMVITQKRLKSVWNTSSTSDVKIVVEDLKEPTGTIVKIKLPKNF